MTNNQQAERNAPSKGQPRRVGLIALITLGVMTAYSLFAPSASENVCAQKEECPACLWLIADSRCPNVSPTPTPTVTPKKTPPLPPIKRRSSKSVFPNSPRFVGDKDLPGLDAQSGTALDVGDNFEQGRRYEAGSVDAEVGRYPERRLYIYRTLELGRLKAAAGEIPQSNVTQLTKILRERLDRINEQERRLYQTALGDELAAERDDVNTNVDKQNKERAAAIEKQIEAMDLDQYDKLADAIQQVITENFSQEREQQLLGEKGTGAFQRAYSIIEKLYNKFKKDCGKKKLNPTTVMGIERMGLLIGMSLDDGGFPSECSTRTAVAKVSIPPGIELEAKKCLSPNARLEDGFAFDGEWQLKVTGVMPMQGKVTISNYGASGRFEAKSPNLAAIHGDGKDSVVLDSDGDAEIVSSGGKCLLWLKPGATKADAQTEQYREVVKMPFPYSGKFPITIENKTCDVKQ